MKIIKKENLLSILWFILGFGIFMFTRRSEVLPTIQIAIIIAPVFILRFIRIQPAGRGIVFTLFGFLISLNIALWGLFKIDNVFIMFIFNFVRSLLLAGLYFLPYLLDRLIYPYIKNKGIISTLIFPVTAVMIFFLSSLEGPFDGDTAKSIYAFGSVIFKQLASICGLWGFIFIYSWIASIINYCWENKFEWKKIYKILFLFSSIVLIIIVYGIIKVSSIVSKKSDKVKTASIILIPNDGKEISMMEILKNKKTSSYDKTISRIKKLTREASLNNAKIVAFQEFVITINEEDEYKLKEAYKKIAKENDIYLSITYGYYSKNGKGENKHLLINNNGGIELDYSKRYLFGIGNIEEMRGELSMFKKGPEIIQTVDTPFGRIGISICRDMNFQAYIKQAGKKDVDIMIGPSYDFPKSKRPSYSLRAIENGFSFIRPTYNGITYAEDYNGKIIAKMDSDKTENGIMYADVPVKGVKTIYNLIGDLFSLICCIVFIIFTIAAVIKKINVNFSSF